MEDYYDDYEDDFEDFDPNDPEASFYGFEQEIVDTDSMIESFEELDYLDY